MNELLFSSGTSYEYPLIIKKILTSALRYAPARTICYRDGLTYTYTTLEDRIKRLAGTLSALGVKKGDVVGMIDYNSHRFLESYFAVPMMGAVLATFNWRQGIDEFGHTISHAAPRVLIVHEDFLCLLKKVKDSLGHVDHLVLITETDHPEEPLFSFTGEYEDLLAQAPPEYEFEDFDENTPATLYYTSGTTGLPKGVSFTHRQIVLQTLSLGLTLGSYSSKIRFSSKDVFMPLVPMWKEHAWGLPYLATMLGAQQVYTGKFEMECMLHLFTEYRITFSVCVPTALHMILEHPYAKELDFSSCKLIVTGALLSEKLAKIALSRGLQITSAFGLSEACPLVSMTHLKGDLDGRTTKKKIDVLASAGLPAPLVDVEIAETSGHLKKTDNLSQGQIVIRAPWLAREYHRDPKKSMELWKHGWLHTGDLGFIDKDGYIHVTDRVRNISKSGGEWVSHLKIENLVRKYPGVEEAAVVAIPDEVWGERPAVFVVIDNAHEVTVDSVQIEKFMHSFVRTGDLPKYALPDRYLIVDEIPKTEVQKIDVREIMERYGDLLFSAG